MQRKVDPLVTPYTTYTAILATSGVNFKNAPPAASALINSAAPSPIPYATICVCPLFTCGTDDTSATRSLRTPRTRRWLSSTASASSAAPILHVPEAW